MTSSEPQSEQMSKEIATWNGRFPVGVAVRCDLYPDKVCTTRTVAMPLFDRKAVIYLEGYNGYFDLHQIHPVPGGDRTEQCAPAVKRAEPGRVGATRVGLLFPGQGAQQKGMGRDLFSQFAGHVHRAIELIGYSLPTLCLDDPKQQLNLTQYTQVALYVVNALGYLRRVEQSGPIGAQDFLLGHSLGEYNALFLLLAFSISRPGWALVKKRGELMAAVGGGATAAVLKAEPGNLQLILQDEGLTSIDIANLNTPMQTVISGPSEAIARATQILASRQIDVLPLRTSAAFHSRYMRDAQAAFAEYLKGFTFSTPNAVVIANATARPYEADNIAELLSRQISASPVHWTDSIRYVLRTRKTWSSRK